MPDNSTSRPTGFSLTIARDLAALSAAAYDPAPVGFGLTVLDYAPLDLRALVSRCGDHIEIAFRGTKDLANWLLDLDVRKEPLAYGVRVHAGFLAAAERLLPLLLAELLPPSLAKEAVPPLRITGHSLGGAVASLVALFLQREGLRVEAVYTFGSPRVGNAAWRAAYSEALGECSYRVIAEGDLVPLVPGLLDGYRHVGQEILLTPHGIFAYPPPWWEILHGSLRVINALAHRQPDCVVEFHSMDRDYLALLDGKAGERLNAKG